MQLPTFTSSEDELTIRDWFAAQASDEDIRLYRVPSRGPSGLVTHYKYSRVEARYRFADAMLLARIQ